VFWQRKRKISELKWHFNKYIRGRLVSLWLYKENKKLRDLKKMYLLYIFPPRAPHTHNFVVLTSLTHPRNINLVLLQIGKAKDLSPHIPSTQKTGETGQETEINLILLRRRRHSSSG
jgi:hypothetical protein